MATMIVVHRRSLERARPRSHELQHDGVAAPQRRELRERGAGGGPPARALEPRRERRALVQAQGREFHRAEPTHRAEVHALDERVALRLGHRAAVHVEAGADVVVRLAPGARAKVLARHPGRARTECRGGGVGKGESGVGGPWDETGTI